jgi:hypothetical protein
MRVWRETVATDFVDDFGEYYANHSTATAHGVEAYREVDATGFAMFRGVTDGIVQTVAQKLATEFLPIEEEHSRHIHIISTYDFGAGRQQIPVKSGTFRGLEFELAANMPAKSANHRLVVYVAGLLFQKKESSLAFSYALGSRALAQESIRAVQIWDSDLFAQPNITAGELLSPSKSITPQHIENAVQSTFEKSYSGLIDRSVDIGPLAIRPF